MAVTMITGTKVLARPFKDPDLSAFNVLSVPVVVEPLRPAPSRGSSV